MDLIDFGRLLWFYYDFATTKNEHLKTETLTEASRG